MIRQNKIAKRGKGKKGKRESRRISLSPFPLFAFSPRKEEGGWTLIELVVTITVLAVLTTGIIPLVKTSVKRQREQRLRETLREMREAIKEFHRDTIGLQCAGGAATPLSQQVVQQGTPNSNLLAGGGNQLSGGQNVLPPMPYVDPRSKVVISDCTIFGVNNPDHYPPKLETLIEGVNVVPRIAPISAGIGGQQATDNKLVSLKKKVYLRAIPVDPMTGKAEWDLRSCYDSLDSGSWGGENVFDVRSKSTDTALNGEKYSEW